MTAATEDDEADLLARIEQAADQINAWTAERKPLCAKRSHAVCRNARSHPTRPSINLRSAG